MTCGKETNRNHKEVYKWAIGGTNRKIEKKSIMHDFKPKTTILYA
jgi:hypothetical protein